MIIATGLPRIEVCWDADLDEVLLDRQWNAVEQRILWQKRRNGSTATINTICYHSFRPSSWYIWFFDSFSIYARSRTRIAHSWLAETSL